MWQTIFAGGNLLAMACWALLILAPRTALTRAVTFYCGVGLLCLLYSVLLVLLLAGLVDGNSLPGAGEASFTSIVGVRAFFLSDGGVTVGWLHYLALDLFAGSWIARDADGKGFPRLGQAAVLILTFLAGPVGLLVWLAIREPAARRAAGPRKSVNR